MAGVPVVPQRKRIQLGTVRLWVPSLASLRCLPSDLRSSTAGPIPQALCGPALGMNGVRGGRQRGVEPRLGRGGVTIRVPLLLPLAPIISS